MCFPDEGCQSVIEMLQTTFLPTTAISPELQALIIVFIYQYKLPPTQSQLLDHSERLLVDLCRDLHDPGMPFSLELRTRAYLSLAEVALTQHHSSTAIQLSLAAMRLLQGASSAARQRYG